MDFLVGLAASSGLSVRFGYFAVVIVIVIVVSDRSRVHIHMPISYRASKGTPIAPQHTGNNGYNGCARVAGAQS
jgi:hypothetical protein